MECAATTTAPTPISITNHSYFNLGGHSSGKVDGHRLWMDAPQYTPVDKQLIPTGEILEVKDTALDFRGNPTLEEAFAKL